MKRAIVDTDFGVMNDDCIACLLALEHPELELVGITTVGGNYDVGSEVAAALKIFEDVADGEIPICAGAAGPLVHQRGEYENASWGGWGTSPEVTPPLGSFSKRPPDPRHAADFIVETARGDPGEVTLIAIGPLTNIALALARNPGLAEDLRQIVIMGGAVSSLPRGAGNHTPTAEFNVWVDAEAAATVLGSGARILLVPLNATRCVRFEEELARSFAKSRNRSVGRLFEEIVLPLFDRPATDPERSAIVEYGLCDSVAVIAAIHPELLARRKMFVSVETKPGPGYGTTYAYVLAGREDAVAAGEPWAWTGFAQPAHLVSEANPPDPIDVAVAVNPAPFLSHLREAMTGSSAAEADAASATVGTRPRGARTVTRTLAVAVSGRGLVRPDEAILSADDDAFARGRAAFETLRVYHGRPFRLGEHLHRLEGSAARIGLPAPDLDEVRELAELAMRAADVESAVLRLYWTPGPSGEDRPLALALVGPIPAWIEPARTRGLRAVTLMCPRRSEPWLLPGTKSTSWAVHVAAELEARGRGVDDAVFVDADEVVLEGPASNVWWRYGRTLHTPSLDLGILAGLTRAALIELAASCGYDLQQDAYPLEHLTGADEAFASSSVREVMPIVELDGRTIGRGPAADELQKALRELAEEVEPPPAGRDQPPPTAPTERRVTVKPHPGLPSH